MKVISAADLSMSPFGYREIAGTLSRDGLACFPAGPQYRLAANLFSEQAVMRLMQCKRRSAYHPALIFVPDARALGQVVHHVPPAARLLAEKFWPGPLTLLLEPSADLPPKVAKTLAKATGKIGVCCPGHAIANRVVREFGGPILVSSANMERKTGANSVAQVRKSFQQRIDVCVDAGDLAPGPRSTLVEVCMDRWTVAREGAIPATHIAAVLGDPGVIHASGHADHPVQGSN